MLLILFRPGVITDPDLVGFILLARFRSIYDQLPLHSKNELLSRHYAVTEH